MVRLDIFVLADIRVGDVAADCHAAALSALAKRGYRIGLQPVISYAINADPYLCSQSYATLFEDGTICKISPDAEVDCTFALAFDSRIFSTRLAKSAKVQSSVQIVTVERPLTLANTNRTELEKIAFSAELALGGSPVWAPSTLLCRDALASVAPDWPLTEEDWPPVAPELPSLPDRPVEAARPNVGIGRIAQSRPSLPQDNDSQLDALFSSPVISWRLRGCAETLKIQWPQPAPVQLWPEKALTFPEFLGRVDVLANPDVASEDPTPVEVLMALRAGVVPYLEPAYRSTFGGAALYGGLRDLPGIATDLHGEHGVKADLLANAAAQLETIFCAERFVERVEGLIGTPRANPHSPSIHCCPNTPILFYSSNGVGMGHLTRQLAIARRLPGRFQPIFLSHSQAVDTARQFGYPVEYLPYHLAHRVARAHWNASLTESLTAAIGFYRPAALVFDGNVPFVGLMTALERAPEVARIWIRRGMWGLSRDIDALHRGGAFDLVVEPNEIAPELDDGPTAERRKDSLCVSPITILDPDQQLDRTAACAALGLNPDDTNVLLSPGSGNNFDTLKIAEQAVGALAKRPDVGIALAEWAISEKTVSIPSTLPRLKGYPFSQFHNAFDFSIAAAGYNTFAEHVACALPTIWVPNEHAQQDRQILRAAFAKDAGFGDLVPTTKFFALQQALDRMLDRKTRERMVQTMTQFTARRALCNGADEAALAISKIGMSAIATRNARAADEKHGSSDPGS